MARMPGACKSDSASCGSAQPLQGQGLHLCPSLRRSAARKIPLAHVESLSTKAAVPRNAPPFVHQFIDEAVLQRHRDVLAKTSRATELFRLRLDLCIYFQCTRLANITQAPDR